MMDDKEKDDTEGLPTLTPKQRKFIMGIKAGMRQVEAYKAAYDCKRQNNETIYVNACRLAASNTVKPWINHVTKLTLKELTSIEKYSKQVYINELSTRIEQAFEAGSFAAGFNGLRQVGQALGHLTENINVNKTITKRDESMLDQLEAMLGRESREEAEKLLGYAVEKPSKERKH